MPQWARELRPTHGNTVKANQKKEARRQVPSTQDIMDVPPADAGVYMLTQREIKSTRSRIYALNKDNAFGWRWRTLVEPGRGRYQQFLIWRIH